MKASLKMCKPPHCNESIDWSATSPKVTYSLGGRYLKVAFARSPAMEWNQEQFFKRDVKRGRCKGFSFGSRRRMLDRLNQISVSADHPDFVTLTLPDDCFEDSVAAFAKTAKLHLDVLLKRLGRVCESACGFWRIEWKARKSGKHEGKLFPHFHLLVWGLGQRVVGRSLDGQDLLDSFLPEASCQAEFAGLCSEIEKGRIWESYRQAESFGRRASFAHACAEKAWSNPVNNYMSFFDWVSLNWYHVVGTGNTDHFLAGCRVEKIRTWGGVLSYCAKYMSKADAEGFMAEIESGRSWGMFNRAMMPWAKLITLELDDDVGNRVRRIARRYLEHRLGKRVQRHYGITLYCDTARFVPLFAPPREAPF